MSDSYRAGGGAPAWPPPHPIIDAPYGPRYNPPPPTPDADPRPPIEPTPRSKRWLVVFATVCLLVAAIGGFLAVRFVTGSSGTRQWPDQMKPLATFVEANTGAAFRHAVPVQFLPDDKFEAIVTRQQAALSEADRRQLLDDEAVGRALGWYSGDTKLFDDTNDIDAAGILAFYSYSAERIVVRSNDQGKGPFDVALRVTLVHELTHTMQDQRFGGLAPLLEKSASDEAHQAALAVVEGHAESVANAYMLSLSEAEQAQYAAIASQISADIDASVGDLSNVLVAPGIVPYRFGPALVQAAQQSSIGVRGLFHKPPVAMDQVLDPRGYFDEDLPGEAPVAPSTPAGGSFVRTGTVGPVVLYLMLATVMSPSEAWDATLLWDNDSYLVYRQNERVCVNWVLRTDSDDQQAALQTALDTWSATRVAAAEVTKLGRPLAYVLCDPGPDIQQPLVSDSATTALFTRSDVLSYLLGRTGSVDAASCATDELFHTFPADQLAVFTPAVMAETDQLVSHCP